MPGLRPLLLVAAVAVCGCTPRPSSDVSRIGDPGRGADLIAAAGCGACHRIPGLDNARGDVGPPLDHMAKRALAAGVLPNRPREMVRWLVDPQAVKPGDAMPATGLDAAEAGDVAAYLYTLD